ncbi:MAG: hypothetical protein RSB41_03710, partial [Bacilli bacterium]
MNDAFSYRLLFDYIKDNSSKKLLDFYRDLDSFNIKQAFFDELFFDKKRIHEFREGHKCILSFIQLVGYEFIINNEEDIKDVIRELDKSDKILKYCENARLLEKYLSGEVSLRIKSEDIQEHIYNITYEKGSKRINYIIKPYSDGIINVNNTLTEENKILFDVSLPSNCTYYIVCENGKDTSLKYLYLKDFDFNIEGLIKERGLNNLSIPKAYVKVLK